MMAFQNVGTGFTNIDRVLNANQGAGAAVSAASNDPMNQEQGRLKDATQPAMDALNAAGKNGAPKTYSTQDIAGLAGSPSQLSGAINQKWQGPASVSFNPSSASQDQLNALANSATAGRQLAINAGQAQGSYSPQMGALDSAVYGSGANKDASANVGKSLSAFNAGAQQQVGAINKGITDISGQLAASGQSAKDAAAKLKDQIMAGAQGKATAATNQLRSDQANGTVRDSNGNVVPISADQQRGGWNGSTDAATAGQFLTPDQANQLTNINKALGIANDTPALSSFNPGHYAINPNPNGPAATTAANKRQAAMSTVLGGNGPSENAEAVYHMQNPGLFGPAQGAFQYAFNQPPPNTGTGIMGTLQRIQEAARKQNGG